MLQFTIASSMFLVLATLLLAADAFQPLISRQLHNSNGLFASVVDSATSSATTTPCNPYKLPPIPANAKRLFLLRHGEVVNPGGTRKVFYGDMNVPLTLLGQKEACIAAAYLSENVSLKAVYSSPLQRAFYGAQQVGSRQEELLEPVRLDGFSELKRGAWRGRTKEEIGAEQLERFDRCDLSVTPARGESFPELKERVTKAQELVLNSLDFGECAAIVSHLQVTRCMVADALNIPVEKMTTIDIGTASVTCIDYIYHVVPQQVIRFQSFKPQSGLADSDDGAN